MPYKNKAKQKRKIILYDILLPKGNEEKEKAKAAKQAVTK